MFTRRGILKRIGLAAPAAVLGADQARMELLDSAGTQLIARPSCGEPANTGHTRVTSLIKYMMHYEGEIREEAAYINGFDADLIERRLPLATKVRLQKERNLRRVREQYKNRFMRALSQHGFAKLYS